MKEKKIDEINKKKTGHEVAAELRNRAEDELQCNSAIITEVIDAIITTKNDEGFTITNWNPGAENIYGWKKKEALGRSSMFLQNEYSGQNQKEILEKILKSGLYEGEVIQRRKDGTRVFVEARVIARKDNNGETTGWICINRDITERKRVESQRKVALEALRESEEKYRTLFDNASEAIFVVQDGKLVFCNPMTTRLIGYSSEEIRTKSFTEFIYPDDRNMVVERHLKRLRGEETPELYSLRIVDRAGNTHWAEISVVLINWEGKAATLNFANDITERKLVELQKNAVLEALLRSEENFRHSLEDSPLGIRVMTGKGETIYANKVLLDIYGYSNVEELNKIPIKERYTPQSYAEFQIRKKVRDQGDFGPNEYEIAIVRKNGEIRRLQVFRKEIFWNATKKFQVIYQDISERMRTELELYESEARYRAFFNTSRDCAYITSVSGRWLYMNDAAVELFGYSNREKLSQVNIPDLYTNPEERAKCIRITMERGYIKEFPVDLRRKDGAVIHALITEVPRYDADGNVLGFQGTIRDITERRRAEEEIMRGKAFLDQLIETAPEAIVIADCQDRVLQVNNEFMHMFGYTSDEAIGKQVNDLLAFPECQEEAAVITESILQGKKIVLETMRRRKDGSIFDVSIVGAPINISGRLEAIYAIYRDISERKLAEKTIRVSLAEKEVLLKEVHHRVKNNLMIIIGLIKMQETKANNETFKSLLLELEGRVRSMALIHENLIKSKDLVHIDLQNYIETMIAHIRTQFGTQHAIRLRMQAIEMEVDLDFAVPCGLILNELITNAFKHAFPGDKPRTGEDNCEIIVAVKHESGIFTLTVADNGVGLPEGTNWENPETLGLQLVKMLSQQIKVSLEMERSSGTVFRLKFTNMKNSLKLS